MRVVDSSIWVEFFAGAALADRAARYVSPPEDIITPMLVLYEVHRWARRERGDPAGMLVVGQLEQTRLEPVDHVVAIAAAELGADHGLAAVDSVIYATARLHRAELVTADADFRGLPGVTLLEP
jgi:predicted nucleic acid-binding protein